MTEPRQRRWPPDLRPLQHFYKAQEKRQEKQEMGQEQDVAERCRTAAAPTAAAYRSGCRTRSSQPQSRR